MRRFDREVDADWRRTSYSALIRADEGTHVGSEPEGGGKDDEPAEPEAVTETPSEGPRSPMADLPAGAAFGTLVHAVLEHADPKAPDLEAELLADPKFCTIDERLALMVKEIAKVKQESGRTVLYALNVTDAPAKQAEAIERTLKAGANCLMFNVPTIGWASFAEAVRQIDGRVPVLAHPDFAGAYFGSPHYGVSSQLVLGKFMRMAGADFVESYGGRVHLAALRSGFSTTRTLQRLGAA